MFFEYSGINISGALTHIRARTLLFKGILSSRNWKNPECNKALGEPLNVLSPQMADVTALC
jgi:hypothetical protein